MKAKSIKGKSAEEIQFALQQSISDNFNPTLAIVFISVKQNAKVVCEIFHKENIDVVGATSCHEFIDNYQSEGEIAAMLFNINKDDYCILFEDIGERTLQQAAEHLAESALQQFQKPALILLSTSITENGAMLDGETLIRSIESIMGSQVNFFGGMAGDDMSFKGTYIFANKKNTNYGMLALVLNEEKIAMHGVALSGWKPIGVSKCITKSNGDLLYEIDDQPALQVYLRFLGQDASSAEDQFKFFDSVGLHYPLQIERENREPMMCNPLGYNKEENALVLESEVQQGARFRFSTPPDFDIVETILGGAKNIQAKAETDGDAVLIFSCASRLTALGPLAEQENNGLHEIWNAPVAGFYTYGEFGRAINGKHEFHSTTCSWVALKEK
jgi:hypothetical protein